APRVGCDLGHQWYELKPIAIELIDDVPAGLCLWAVESVAAELAERRLLLQLENAPRATEQVRPALKVGGNARELGERHPRKDEAAFLAGRAVDEQDAALQTPAEEPHRLRFKASQRKMLAKRVGAARAVEVRVPGRVIDHVAAIIADY